MPAVCGHPQERLGLSVAFIWQERERKMKAAGVKGKSGLTQTLAPFPVDCTVWYRASVLLCVKSG